MFKNKLFFYLFALCSITSGSLEAHGPLVLANHLPGWLNKQAKIANLTTTSIPKNATYTIENDLPEWPHQRPEQIPAQPRISWKEYITGKKTVFQSWKAQKAASIVASAKNALKQIKESPKNSTNFIKNAYQGLRNPNSCTLTQQAAAENAKKIAIAGTIAAGLAAYGAGMYKIWLNDQKAFAIRKVKREKERLINELKTQLTNTLSDGYIFPEDNFSQPVAPIEPIKPTKPKEAHFYELLFPVGPTAIPERGSEIFERIKTNPNHTTLREIWRTHQKELEKYQKALEKYKIDTAEYKQKKDELAATLEKFKVTTEKIASISKQISINTQLKNGHTLLDRYLTKFKSNPNLWGDVGINYNGNVFTYADPRKDKLYQYLKANGAKTSRNLQDAQNFKSGLIKARTHTPRTTPMGRAFENIDALPRELQAVILEFVQETPLTKDQWRRALESRPKN